MRLLLRRRRAPLLIPSGTRPRFAWLRDKNGLDVRLEGESGWRNPKLARDGMIREL